MLTVRASGTSYEQVWNMNIFIIRNINGLVHLFLMIFDTLVPFPFFKSRFDEFQVEFGTCGEEAQFRPSLFFLVKFGLLYPKRIL